MNENPPNALPENNSIVTTNISLTPAGRQHLDQTRPWARFLSVILFISTGMMVLAGFGLIMAGMMRRFAPASEGRFGTLLDAVGGASVGLLYIVMGILYVPLGVFLSRYAGAIKSLELNRSAQALEDALKYQKFFWRYAGILTIIGLIFAVFAMVIGLLLSILLIRR